MKLQIFFSSWAVLWVICWLVCKRQNIPQPVGTGWLASMFLLIPLFYGYEHFNPSTAQLRERATNAEQQYFLLSNGSLDHGRICEQAWSAFKNYKKLGDKEKTDLFEYILMTDKCL